MIDAKKDKPRHLGRGLESLLGPITPRPIQNDEALQELQNIHKPIPDKGLGVVMKEVEISQIKVNPYQARTVFEEKELHNLSESIKTNPTIGLPVKSIGRHPFFDRASV